MLDVVGLLHVALPIGTGSDTSLMAARRFYSEVLGLPLDSGRPDIPNTPGYWYNVPAGARPPDAPRVEEREVGPPPVRLRQIHLIGRPTPRADFTAPPPAGDADTAARRSWPVSHVALAVRNLNEAKEELSRQGIDYRIQTQAVGAEQIFFLDPFGNLIELQEAR